MLGLLITWSLFKGKTFCKLNVSERKLKYISSLTQLIKCLTEYYGFNDLKIPVIMLKFKLTDLLFMY